MSHYTGSVPDTAPRTSEWLATAACTEDPDAMFPGTNRHDIEYAKAICRRCPAIEQCLQWALETGQEYGVWGGMAEDERRRMKRAGARPINIDDYTGIPGTRAPVAGRTLQQAWMESTDVDGDHILWNGPKTVTNSEHGNVTPNRLAFYLDRGRWPEGDTKRTCRIGKCVKPSHLNDRQERNAGQQLAAAA